uniref:Tankyrase 1-binding protein C-terminal domain-containing protein n=1 Tax=Paramormyrops kingsleyae TaxID=1676925 RepID=A0A3B3T797_9TELE
MEYFGDKLSVAQSQVSTWASNMRRSLQEALGLLSGAVERPEGQETEETGSGFRRSTSLRGLASRSRESLRNFSTRSQRHLSIRNLRKRLGNLDDDPPVSSDPPAAPGPQDPRALAGNGPREDDGMQDKLLSKEDDHYGSLDTAQHPGEDSPTPTTTPTDALLEPGTPSELPSPSAVSPSAVSSMSWEATDPLPFPETPTSLLDSSALRSRVQLGKRRSQRAPPSRAARQKAAQDAKDPQFQDSAGTRSEMTAQEDVEDEEEEEEEEEEKVKMKTEPCSTPLQPQRVAVFPGLDPSALKAQLKKRAGDSENQAEQLPPQRSAKSPFLPQATRVLPPVTDKENREHSSPQWLQELKSKKRFSQHESDT